MSAPLQTSGNRATPHQQISSRNLILLLGALYTISPISIDMYLSAFTQMAASLHTTTARVALSLSSYFVGLAAGQLLYGPFLDRYGRKPPLYLGLMIYLAASVGCLLSPSVEALIVLRFVQALGGCVAQVATVAMVRDFFPVQENARIFSLLMLILGVSPLLAPTLGSVITSVAGWQWVFAAQIVITGSILGAVWRYLPEGHQPDPSVSLKLRPVLRGFMEILRTPQFFTYTFATSCSFAGLFVYVAASPIIFMEIYQVSAAVYGGIFALLSVGFIGASQLNIWLTRRFSSQALFLAAIAAQITVAGCFLLTEMLGWLSLYSTTAFLLLFLGTTGLSNPNGAALALAPFKRNAGSASALLGAIEIGVAAIISSGVGLFGQIAMAGILTLFLVSSKAALVILLVGRRSIGELIQDEESLDFQEAAETGHLHDKTIA